MRTGGWFITYTGRQFYLTDPHPADVDIVDIAHALSQVCRFGGHCRQFYSVAQHCLHVVEALTELFPDDYRMQLHGLLHDASEAYMSDIVRPLKATMPEYKAAEERMMKVIYQGLGVPEMTKFEHNAVKCADNALLLAERRDLINHGGIEWSIEANPWPNEVRPMDAACIKSSFLRTFDDLRAKVVTTE